MAKWTVEQLKFDPTKEIWSRNGIWAVEAETPQEALKYTFINHLDKADEFDQVISQAKAELYGLTVTVGRKTWSVKPAGAGVPG